VHAAIDVGSNTVRLLIDDFDQGARNSRKHFRKITRLGGRYTSEKGLAPDAMERTLVVLEDFSRRLDQVALKSLRVAGTEVIRKAPNQTQFIRDLETRTGLTLEVLSGAEEAHLSGLGVLAALKPRLGQFLAFDLGGGSLELILFDGQRVVWRHSQPLGVVLLAEQHPTDASRSAAISGQLDEIRTYLNRAGLAERVASPAVPLVGSAGTVTTLAAIERQLDCYRADLIDNTRLHVRWLKALRRTLAALPPDERLAVKGMEPGREDLIIPGLDIVLGLMSLTGKTKLTACDSGLLEGLILERISGRSC